MRAPGSTTPYSVFAFNLYKVYVEYSSILDYVQYRENNISTPENSVFFLCTQNHVMTYLGPSPPWGVCQLMSCVGTLMSQVLQWMQLKTGLAKNLTVIQDQDKTYFWELIWNRTPCCLLGSSTYSYTPAGQNRFSTPLYTGQARSLCCSQSSTCR